MCKRVLLTVENKKDVDGWATCRLRCNMLEFGTVWPKPTGKVEISMNIVMIDPSKITFNEINLKKSEYWTVAEERFIGMQLKKLPKYKIETGGQNLTIVITTETGDMGKHCA